MVKKHEGWKYFTGINHERLRQGKKDEIECFNKLKTLNLLPCDCDFKQTKAWNNQHDFESTNPDIDMTLEIKRRLTYKKFMHLKEYNGWLYLQYNDALFKVEVNKITDNDFAIVYPYKVKHVSINLACFERLE